MCTYILSFCHLSRTHINSSTIHRYTSCVLEILHSPSHHYVVLEISPPLSNTTPIPLSFVPASIHHYPHLCHTPPHPSPPPSFPGLPQGLPSPRPMLRHLYLQWHRQPLHRALLCRPHHSAGTPCHCQGVPTHIPGTENRRGGKRVEVTGKDWGGCDRHQFGSQDRSFVNNDVIHEDVGGVTVECKREITVA